MTRTILRLGGLFLCLVVAWLTMYAAPAAQATLKRGWVAMTQPLLLVNGTAAAPSLAFTNNTALGLYSPNPSGNTWYFAAAGVPRFGIAGTSVSVGSDGTFNWASGSDASGTIDLILARDAANTLALRNVVAAQRFNIGQGNTANAAGRLAMGKDGAAAFAPGGGYGMVRWETGTNAGTLKLMAYSGTSVAGTTVVDNVGAGN